MEFATTKGGSWSYFIHAIIHFSFPFVTVLFDFQRNIIQYKVTQYISEKQQHKNLLFSCKKVKVMVNI